MFRRITSQKIVLLIVTDVRTQIQQIPQHYTSFSVIVYKRIASMFRVVMRHLWKMFRYSECY
jgi:hypothetical protein